jgi:iron complex transport system substrate-binding protein
MFRKILFAFVMIALLVTACTSTQVVTTPTVQPTAIPNTPTAQPTTAPITLVDGLNRTVTLPAAAQRVVSLAPSNTEILFAVGAGTQVVGRDMFSDYPPEAASVQDIGGSMGQYNLEAIVALKPDLVLAGGINPPDLVASLEKLGITVYFLPNPTTLEEMYTNLETVGALTGHQSDAAALVESLKARVAAVDAKIMPLSYGPSVYYEIDATDPTKPYTYGPGSFGDLLLQRAGGFNIGSQLKDPWSSISLEQLVADNPSIVLLGDAAWGETPEKFAARPGLENLDAVKNGQVFPFDDNLVSRPGPRLVDGLEALAKILHPGLFK